MGLDLARQLAHAGADVLCTALDGTAGPLRERCASYAIPVVELDLATRPWLGRNGYSWRLIRRLRALKLDAIHLQHMLALNKLGFAARMAGIKRIVVTEHSEEALQLSFAGRCRARLNWRLCHEITVVHGGIKDYLVAEIGVDPARISVVPLGIDVARWHRNDRDECRAALGIGAQFVFIFVGRVAEVKNVPGLIRAFLAARSRTSIPASLLIVGDGIDLPTCRRVAADHPLGSSVRFMGEQSDVRPYLAAADALLLNSLFEGTPLAILEAMAMGLPAIGPAVGGIPLLLRGHGWLTQPNSEESLRDALLTALADTRQAAAFGLQGSAYIRATHDGDQMLARYRALLLGGGVRGLAR